MSIIVEDMTAATEEAIDVIVSETERSAVRGMADRARATVEHCYPPAALAALAKATVDYAKAVSFSVEELMEYMRKAAGQ